MIVVKPSPNNRFRKFIQTISYGEIALLLVAILFIAIVFTYADGVRAAVTGEHVVRFSQSAGFYESPIELTLSALGSNSASTEIRYTVDGSTPSQNSPKYNGPILIDKTVVLKAVVMQDGLATGKIQTQSYFIGETSTLPVISLITEPEYLWDPTIGIYVEGEGRVNEEGILIPNYEMRGPEWQPPAYMEFYDERGDMQFALEGRIKIHGEGSRKYPQKSVRFCATQGQYMEYKFFADSDVEKYKCILIRNGGNDWIDTLFRDALAQNLLAETSLDIQHYQPTIVFLNGEYWGIQNIRDTYNDYYFNTKYGLDRGEITIIFPDHHLNGYPVVEEGEPGDEKPYVDMVEFVQENDMAEQGNYEYIETLMDVDNYIDYMIAQIYSTNRDWGDSNLRIWRYKNETGDFRDARLPYGVDGRWRWIVYDMDSTMAIFDVAGPTLANALNRPSTDGKDLSWVSALFSNLLKNPEFKAKFINRFIYHVNYTYRPTRFIGMVDEFQAGIRPEIERHIAKWGGLDARPGGRWVSFNSVEEWEEGVQAMRDFAVLRQDYALEQLADQLHLDGVATLHVNLGDGGKAVYIGDLKVTEDDWEGKFIQGLDYPIRAESKFGYTFVGWESNAPVENAAQLALGEMDEVELTPKFEMNAIGQFLSALGVRL